MEERRRTKTIPHFFDERSCLKLVFATLWRASQRWRLVRFNNPEGLLQVGGDVLVPTASSGPPIEGQAGDPGIGTVVTSIIETSAPPDTLPKLYSTGGLRSITLSPRQLNIQNQ